MRETLTTPPRDEQARALGNPAEVFDLVRDETAAARARNPFLTLAAGADDDEQVAFVDGTLAASRFAHLCGRGDARIMVLKLARRAIATLAEQGTPATDVDFFDVRRAVRDAIVARMGAVPPLYSDVMGATVQEAMEEAVRVEYEERAAEYARERVPELGVGCWDGEETAA